MARTLWLHTHLFLDLRIARTSAGGGPSFNYYCDGAEPASPVLYDGFDTYTQGLEQTSSGAAGTSYYILDRLGDNTRMMNANQSVTDALVLDSFGNTLTRTGTTWPNTFGFAAKSGYETDTDTGLMLLGHRFYDPSIGRFLSRDPIHAGMNDYAYVDNDPVESVDPSGEAAQGVNGGNTMGLESTADGSGDSSDDEKTDLAKEAQQKVGNFVDQNGANGYISQAGTEAGNADSGHGSYLKAAGYAAVGTALLASNVVGDGAATGARILGRTALHAVEETAEKTVGKTVLGYTKHAVDQAISREGHGVKPAAILDALRNPKKVVWKVDLKGITQTYHGKTAKVTVNYFSRLIVTVVAMSSRAFR